MKLRLRLALSLLWCATAPWLCVPRYQPAPQVHCSPQATSSHMCTWHQALEHNSNKSDAGVWLKANFHSHSAAWWGLTAGADSEQALVQAYAAQGLDAVALSNYHSISNLTSDSLIVMPAYEHGYSWSKAHRIVMGASTVDYFDLPFGATTHFKQWTLNGLKNEAARPVVMIPHASLRDGHSQHELSVLTGYDALEVWSGLAESVAHYDSALTAGHLVWPLASDKSVFQNWTWVYAAQRTGTALLDAVRQGQVVAMKTLPNMQHWASLRPPSVYTQGSIATVEWHGPVETMEWYGENGVLLKQERHTQTARFSLDQAPGHYVRLEVRANNMRALFPPWFAGSPAPAQTIRWPDTLLMQLVWCLVFAGIWLRLRPARIPISQPPQD
jgi:hypothetical protein